MPRALIVDDKPENLYFLAALLAGNGYAVDKAGDGAEALALARAVPPDLVISDILMPGMDGFALCREWKQDSQLGRIPFVFYTATYTDPKDERLAMGLGADLFLIKPQEPEVFMAQITAILQRHAAGQLLKPRITTMEESNYLREYNAVLVHKLEDKLLQLEHASKVKDLLLGSVSHELRTPLTPVMGLVDLLIHDPRTPPHIREDLETIRRHVEIEKHLIGDLLDYAAMHSGALGLNRQPLSLHVLVQRATALWREQLHTKSLHLELRLEAAADQVLGDQDRLDQVLWNLLHHAVRRSPPHSLIAFHSKNPAPEEIALEVRDTGKPMDAESIAWTFSPFDCVTHTAKQDGRDAGLGLAASKGIVEAHGGRLSIQSMPQAPGATVSVLLPAHRQQRKNSPA